MILEMFFLTLSSADIKFAEKKLTERSYTIAKALLTIKRIELINKKKFVKTALDKNSELFVIHVAALEALKITIYSS